MKARYLLLVLGLLALGYYTVGCGSGGGNNNNSAPAITCPANYVNSNNTCVPVTANQSVATTTATNCQGACGPGSVQVQQNGQLGCLPQGSCTQPCQGMNSNNQCIPGIQTNGTIPGTYPGNSNYPGTYQVNYPSTYYPGYYGYPYPNYPGYYGNGGLTFGVTW